MKVNLTPEGIVTGIGLTLAASVLLPMLKSVARPLAAAGIQGAVTLSNQIKGGVCYLKEEVQDLVAEAQFERMRESIDHDIAQ